MAAVWWWLVHAVLASATLLLGAPWLLAAVLSTVIAGHALYGRGRSAPSVIVVTEEGHCVLPEVSSGLIPLGPQSRLSGYYVHLVNRSRALDVVLFRDQLEPAQWAQLSALLRRAAKRGSIAELV